MNEIIQKSDADLLDSQVGDVYLVAYPKSGITWVTEIVSCIYKEKAKNAETHEKKSYKNATKIHGFCDVCPMSRRKHRHLTEEKVSFDLDGNATYTTAHERRKRIIGLHFPSKRMKHLVANAFSNKEVKIIYVARNSRDVAVSYYHFHEMNKSLPTPSSWEEFYNDFLSGFVRWGSWFEHVNGWWKLKENHENILWMSFEGMKKDLRETVKDIASFLDIHLTDVEVKVVTEKCIFHNMKNDPKRNQRKNSIFSNDFLRKGHVGDWQRLFNLQQHEKFLEEEKKAFGSEYENINKTMVVDTNNGDKKYLTFVAAAAGAILFIGSGCLSLLM